MNGAEAHKPNDAGVWNFVKHGEITEVFVQSHKNPTFQGCALQQGRIAGIAIPLPSPDDVVAFSGEVSLRAAPNARVQQQLHVGAGSNSTRS
jgi:hypothetical protein